MKTTAIRHLIAIVACMLSGILTSNAAKALSKLAVTDVNGMDFTIEVYESSANNNSIDVIIYKNDNPSEKIYGQGTDLHRGFYYMNTDTGLFDIVFANGEFKKAQPFKKIFYIYCDEDNRYIAAKDTKDPGWRLAYKLLPPDPESDSPAPTAFMRLMALNTRVKQFRQWGIPKEMIPEFPNIDFADAAQIEKAIADDTLVDVLYSIPTYDFTDENWTSEAPQTGSICEDIPGTFKIGYNNGMPTTFTLDEEDFEKQMNENGMGLDAFDLGLESFTIEYYSNGMPYCLKGKRMQFFGGGDYQIIYSDYKYDKKGNWISRKKTTPSETQIQYRDYEY